MNIPAAELKSALKKLSPVKSEVYQIGAHGVSAQDSDVWVVNHGVLSDLGDSFNIQGKKLTQVVGRMSGQIEVSREDKKLVLKSAKAKVDLEIQPIKPVVLPEPADKTFSIPSADFRKALTVATASASTNKSAAFGGCVQIQSLLLSLESNTPQGLRVVGTDGNVLTVVRLDTPIPFETKFLLNLEAAQIIQLMDEDISVGETNRHLHISSGKTTVYASKPQQVYPEFDKFISLTPATRFGFSPSMWLDALKTVEPLIDESVDQGSVNLRLKDGVVTFSNVGVGSTAQDEAEYEQVEPDPVFDPVQIRTRFKAEYLSGFLSKAGESAYLGLVSSDKPVRFESGNISVFLMAMKQKEK